MSSTDTYSPGSAEPVEIRKDGETWTLALVRELRHSPDKVWAALTDPAQLHEWAPCDADRNLGTTGAAVNLTTIGTPVVAETHVIRADAPRLLEYDWGGRPIRWELEPTDQGTRLKLWASIDRRYIAMGTAGWHICLDVLDLLLAGAPVGRMAGPGMTCLQDWKRLTKEYTEQFASGDA